MKKIYLYAIAILIPFLGFSQENETEMDTSDKSKWTLTVGVTAVDSKDQSGFGGLLADAFDPGDYKMIAGASRLAVGYELMSGLSANTSANVAKLDDDFFFSWDLKARYSFTSISGGGEPFFGFLDPYVTGGFGYTSVGDDAGFIFSLGAGLNFWINDGVGINLQGDFNRPFSTDSGVPTYFQPSLGLILKM